MTLLCFPFFAIHHHPFFFSPVSNHHRSHFHHKFPKQTFKCSHPFLAAFLQILHVSQVSPSSSLENTRSYPGFLHNAHHFSSISHPIPNTCPALSLHFLVCFHISSMFPARFPPLSQLPTGAPKKNGATGPRRSSSPRRCAAPRRSPKAVPWRSSSGCRWRRKRVWPPGEIFAGECLFIDLDR